MAAHPKTEIDMRHTKLKASEAAILAGELNKPSWESKNEGIHERVSFEDTIWGFDLAGGSFYKTPLRVTYIKPGSRAEKAGIRPGDKLKRINDIDTSTLTIQEAHEIIVESGIHLRLAVSAPDDEEDSYSCWQDPIDTGYDSEEERRRLEAEKVKKREVHCKVSSYWSLQWPWVSKRRVIYRESNCFMVPSKFESHHRDKFPLEGSYRSPEDIALYSAQKELEDLKKKEMLSEAVNGNNADTNVENKDVIPASQINATKDQNSIPKTDSTKEKVSESHDNGKTLIDDLSKSYEHDTANDDKILDEILGQGADDNNGTISNDEFVNEADNDITEQEDLDYSNNVTSEENTLDEEEVLTEKMVEKDVDEDNSNLLTNGILENSDAMSVDENER